MNIYKHLSFPFIWGYFFTEVEWIESTCSEQVLGYIAENW